MKNIEAKKVAKYVLLPGVIPRARDLFASGFGYIAFLIAAIYGSVRLLPPNHPYLLQENLGRFGLRHVIGEAANHLVINRKNIDQIVIFVLMLCALVILFMQFGLLAYGYIIQPALAQIPVASMFNTPHPEKDIAFILLDKVFGIPDFFCNSAGLCSEANVSVREPFHIAFHEMLRFYSLGMLFVGVLIFLYFVIVVVGETAISGTPFGQRFQNIWVPIRLVVAIGLLMPINYGLNAGQYIALYAAKAGSGLATNAWLGYNDELALSMGRAGASSVMAGGASTGSPTGPYAKGEEYNPTGESLLALPNAPDIAPVLQFMSLVHSCAYAHWHLHEPAKDEDPKRAEPIINAGGYVENYQNEVQLYFVRNLLPRADNKIVNGMDPEVADRLKVTKDTTYLEALDFFNNGDIIFRFGSQMPMSKAPGATEETANPDDKAHYERFKGNVDPVCGELRVPITDLSQRGKGQGKTTGGGSVSYPGGVNPDGTINMGQSTVPETSDGVGGADLMQNFYFDLVMYLWFADSNPRNTGNLGSAGSRNRELVQLSQRATAMKMSKLKMVEKDGEDVGVHCAIGCDNPNLPSCGNAATPLPASSRFSVLNALNIPYCNYWEPSLYARQDLIDGFQPILNETVKEAWDKFNKNAMIQHIDAELLHRGWGGAGIWYNKINQINGSFINAVMAVPKPVSYPRIMDHVRRKRALSSDDPSPEEQFNPRLAKGNYVSFEESDANYLLSESSALDAAGAFHDFYKWWVANEGNNADPGTSRTGVIFQDIINLIFGLDGLMNIRGENASIHPLAQLTSIGKGLVDSAVQNVAASTLASFMGGPLSVLSPSFGALAQQAGSFLVSTAFMGLTAGFVLFYVLPFLPFLYFFFAVGGWVKSLFEAMVGLPLWALAHLRIDGEGLPGDAASNGYFLIFEIFIRPIMIVVALIASMLVFTTQVRVLNFIWDLVTTNLTGYTPDKNLFVMDGFGMADRLYDTGFIPEEDMLALVNAEAFDEFSFALRRDSVDQFFYTVMYTVICYMLATASFKLINEIPNSILRWIGSGTSTFGDMTEDATSGLTSTVAQSGMIYGQQVTQATQGFAGSVGKALADELNKGKGS